MPLSRSVQSSGKPSKLYLSSLESITQSNCGNVIRYLAPCLAKCIRLNCVYTYIYVYVYIFMYRYIHIYILLSILVKPFSWTSWFFQQSKYFSSAVVILYNITCCNFLNWFWKNFVILTCPSESWKFSLCVIIPASLCTSFLVMISPGDIFQNNLSGNLTSWFVNINMEWYTNTLLSSLRMARNLNIHRAENRPNTRSSNILLCGKNSVTYLCDKVQKYNIQKYVCLLLGRIFLYELFKLRPELFCT